MKVFTITFLLISKSLFGDNWIQCASMPGSGREGSSSFTIQDKGFVCGGVDVYTHIYFHDLWEYDPDNNIWTQKADLAAQGCAFSASLVINGRAFVIGGQDSLENVQTETWEYSTISNSWQQRADMLFPLWCHGSFTIGDKGYVVGGVGANGLYYNTLYEYNLTNDEWFLKSPFPGEGRMLPGTFVINNIGYVCFGNNFGSFLTDVYAYEPINDQWSTKSSLPYTDIRWASASFGLGNNGYIIGGIGIDGLLTDVLKYNPVNDTWFKKTEFPSSGKAYSCYFVIDNSAYFGMGMDTNQNYVNDLCKYTPDSLVYVEDRDILSRALIGPNPFENKILINFGNNPNKGIMLSLYNEMGKLIYKASITSNIIELNMLQYKAGIYFIHLLSNENDKIFKVIKL